MAEHSQRGEELARVKAELNQLRIRDAEREKVIHLTNNQEKVEVSQNFQKEMEISREDDLDQEEEKQELICYCNGSIMNHYECSNCGHVWCLSPEDKDRSQDPITCPKCSPFQAQESS